LSPLTYTITPKGGIKRKMKILKSKKALSPVVASIILIAVTVAVSIAVAAWMGALTFTFTKNENIKMPTATDVKFSGTAGASDNSIELAIENLGTSAVTIVSVKVNAVAKTCNVTLPVNLDPAASLAFKINNVGWKAGYQYRVTFVTSNHNEFFQDYTAPVG